MKLLEDAYKIDTFASYLESCGIRDEEEIKSAARYMVDCIDMGEENGRWCDASASEKNAMKRFVKKYC